MILLCLTLSFHLMTCHRVGRSVVRLNGYCGDINQRLFAGISMSRRHHVIPLSMLDFRTTNFETVADIFAPLSESTSIPKNPRTDRPVGYAFVDLSTPSEAERAIAELSGKEILERKVSVQLARKPEPAEKGEGAASGGEGQSGGEGGRRRSSGRGRGRGRGRGGRGARGGRVSYKALGLSMEH